jgi:hypothetical protein
MSESHPMVAAAGVKSPDRRSILFASLGEIVEWFDFMVATFFMGPAITAAMEHFPTEVRFSGFAFGYNAGAGLFGGTTPLLASWLIHSTGLLKAPSFYLIGAAAVLLVICLKLRETFNVDLRA